LQQRFRGIEVASRQHLHGEATPGLRLPCKQFVEGDAHVFCPGKNGHGAIQGLALLKAVAFDDGDIGAQDGKEDFHQLRIAKNLLWQALIKTGELANELCVWECVERVWIRCNMWRTPAGEKEPPGHWLARALDSANPLEGQQGAHAVPEDGEGKIEPGFQLPSEGVGERIEIGVGRFAAPRFAAGQKNRADLYTGRQPGVPGAESGGSAASVGQAEEAHAYRLDGGAELEPDFVLSQDGAPGAILSFTADLALQRTASLRFVRAVQPLDSTVRPLAD